MPQSLVHIIFSTKNRMAFLQSAELRSEVHAYLTATLRGLQCEPLQVGGMEDHVHILSGLSRTTSLAELVKKFKTSSTMTVKAKGHSHFSWQSRYGAFSVSQSAKESLIASIASQEIHHCKMTFEEEFRTLLQKHGMPFNERSAWD
jgi:putative transposase